MAQLKSLTIALSGVVIASITSGCAVVSSRMPLPNGLVAAKAVIPGIPYARFWGDILPSGYNSSFIRGSRNTARLAYARAANGRPVVNYLALSGGGGDGAFGAGLLNGWTARGTRPTFHIVTGVSAGAIIAPFAFLGPKHDRELRKIWTKYKAQDLAVAQILTGLLGGASLADTAPLKKLVAKYVTRKFLREIAREYAKGRLLLIATTNLDAQRPVIWNMGEIAMSRRADAVLLFRQIILASSAVPAAFPPQHIKVISGNRRYEELHVDGGVTKEVFIGPPQLKLRAFDHLYPSPPIRRIYIIKNGKLAPQFSQVKPNAIKIATRSIATLIKYQNKGDIFRIYRQAVEAGARFSLTAVPADFNVKAARLFDPAYQAALFKRGFEMGRSGQAWVSRPPELQRIRPKGL